MDGLGQLCLTCGTLSTFAVRRIDHIRLSNTIFMLNLWTVLFRPLRIH